MSTNIIQLLHTCNTKSPKMNEDNLQSKCYQWFWNTYPNHRRLLFHVPNGGFRTKVEAARFKAMGLLAGVPDLLLLQAPARLYAFELKTSTGRLSPEQAKLHETWAVAGVEVQIIRSLDEFQQAIKTIIP